MKLGDNMKLYSFTKEFPVVGKLTFLADDNYLYRITLGADLTHENKLNKVIELAITELDEYFKGTRTDFSVPYKLNGTTFQKAVWNELLQIPYGTAINYQELAKRVNNVHGSRAVGNANRANPIPIIVPCHRVIRKNNTLGGYAGTKSDIKEKLLRGENYDFTKIILWSTRLWISA